MKRPHQTRFDFFLGEMLAAMQRIVDYTANIKSYHEFSSNHLVRDAVIRNFQIMGESVKHVPFNYQRKHPKLPWSHMISMRNFIVHEFFDVDDEILWEIINTDLKSNITDLEILLGHYQKEVH